MKYFRNTIFILAIVVLIIWLGLPFYLLAKDYQLKQPWKDAYETSRIYLVPIAILFTLFKTLKWYDDAEDEGWKVLITCFIAAVFMIVFTIAYVITDHNPVRETLFTKPDDPEVSVVIQGNGPILTTNPDFLKVIQVENISTLFEQIRPIDTTTLDSKAWIRHP